MKTHKNHSVNNKPPICLGSNQRQQQPRKETALDKHILSAINYVLMCAHHYSSEHGHGRRRCPRVDTSTSFGFSYTSRRLVFDTSILMKHKQSVLYD